MAVLQEGYVTVQLFVLTVVQTFAFTRCISQINTKIIWQQVQCCCAFWHEGCEPWSQWVGTVGSESSAASNLVISLVIYSQYLSNLLSHLQPVTQSTPASNLVIYLAISRQ